MFAPGLRLYSSVFCLSELPEFLSPAHLLHIQLFIESVRRRLRQVRWSSHLHTVRSHVPQHACKKAQVQRAASRLYRDSRPLQSWVKKDLGNRSEKVGRELYLLLMLTEPKFLFSPNERWESGPGLGPNRGCGASFRRARDQGGRDRRGSWTGKRGGRRATRRCPRWRWAKAVRPIKGLRWGPGPRPPPGAVLAPEGRAAALTEWRKQPGAVCAPIKAVSSFSTK